MATTHKTTRSKPVAKVEAREEAMRPIEDFLQYARAYARKNPEATALTCLGIGFVLGWKLKPW